MVDVEKEHVHKVYSKIAAHFSDTRFKAWPRIAQFLQSQPPGSFIADVGCGNGKYLGVNPQVFMLGSDICPELVAIGRSRGHEVLTCDCLHLPYRQNLFDGVICIAVIHHLSSECRRLDSITEMARVLRPGGKLLVYVWAMEQERKKFDGQDVMVPWHLQPKYSAGGKGSCVERASTAEAKAARARAKNQEKKRRKGKEKGRAFTGGGGEIPAGAGAKANVTSCVTEEGSQDEVPDLETENSEAGKERECEHDSICDSTCDSTCDSSSGEVRRQQFSQQGYTTYQRYYHVFRQGELVELFHKVPQLCVEEEFYDHENWCVLAEKI